MGQVIDTISGFVTAPGAVLTAWTMAAGDSVVIRGANPAKRNLMLDAWAFNQAAGIFRVRSPRLHDSTQGLRWRIPGNSQAFGLLDPRYPQVVYPTDQLTIEQSGSAVGGQIETGSILIYYEDMTGLSANMIGWDELQKRAIELFTQECVLVPGAAGGYSGQVALNAASDRMKAGKAYAMVGYVTDAQNATISVRGPDTGQLRVSGPANNLSRDTTRFYWSRIAQEYNLPIIPVIRQLNRAATFVDCVANQAATAINVNLLFVEVADAA